MSVQNMEDGDISDRFDDENHPQDRGDDYGGGYSDNAGYNDYDGNKQGRFPGPRGPGPRGYNMRGPPRSIIFY